MKIGIAKESLAGEKRVAATPETVAQLLNLGYEVLVEKEAGVDAGFTDELYREAGASLASKEAAWSADILYKVNAPDTEEIERLKDHAMLVSFLAPAQHPERLKVLNDKKITALAMDMVPRISRAQAMDALSSIANISGYKAVIEAAHEFGRFFSGQITAAGKIPPAKVLVIGAGVAGLAAIGTSVSLGAVVRAFDTRLEVAEQIESLGGKFLKLDFGGETGGSSDGYAKVMSPEFIAAEMKLFAEEAREVDIIITTAAIPGKPSPKLITKEMIETMKPGSIIVDLAALGGGNTELTVPGKKITTKNNVTIIGYTDFASRLPAQSSRLYATNLVNLTKLITPNKDGVPNLNLDDVIIRNMTVIDSGKILFPPPPIQVSAAPPPAAKAQTPAKKEEVKKPKPLWQKILPFIIGALLFLWVGAKLPQEFLNHFTVFALACVVGYYVVWNVTAALHTPLMSVTNAISGIIIVGALAQIGGGHAWVSLLSFIGILLVSVNIFGGFAVTKRMLAMFRKD